jgi:hypothetical protein
MSHSIDYHLIAFHFEQGTIDADSKSVFRCGVRQAFDITLKIIPHCFNLFDDALCVAPVNAFQVFHGPGFEFDFINHLALDIEITPYHNPASMPISSPAAVSDSEFTSFDLALTFAFALRSLPFALSSLPLEFEIRNRLAPCCTYFLPEFAKPICLRGEVGGVMS